MEDNAKTTYIDVREPMEFAAGHLEGAINIPVGSISDGVTALQGIPKDSKLVVYCRSGGRAENARAQLQQLGFNDVVNGINQDAIESNN
ncbi:MAG: phage shock protein [Patescibacteria group bacterium]|jgi:phage shock protein E|nr:phage shock protein [Patescibacteria group bacterium]